MHCGAAPSPRVPKISPLGQRLSYPCCHTGRMKSEETIGEEAAALGRVLAEWASITAQLIDVVNDAAERESSANWRPHAGQIIAAVSRFRALCEAQIEEISDWRPDGLEPEEVRAWVWAEGDRLAKWLQRMTQE